MTAIYFVVGFVVVLGAFITFIGVLAARLGPAVAPRLYSRVETIIIVGILLGTASMVQPWVSAGLQWGFLLLLFSTLAFIVWSHVTPKRATNRAGRPDSAAPSGAPTEKTS
jgi:multisubunit Na+/H+ antiporter MnhG subunit